MCSSACFTSETQAVKLRARFLEPLIVTKHAAMMDNGSAMAKDRNLLSILFQ